MTLKSRYILPFAGLTLMATLSVAAEAQSTAAGSPSPAHYAFSTPSGDKGGAPANAKPAYQGVNLALTCKEATGILKMHGYRDIAELSCTGNVYRFEVSRVEGRFIIDLDPLTGSILRRRQL